MPTDGRLDLTLILLTWRIWWAPSNANRWQMGFNSAFKCLHVRSVIIGSRLLLRVDCGSNCRWSWEVSLTLRPLYSRPKNLVLPAEQESLWTFRRTNNNFPVSRFDSGLPSPQFSHYIACALLAVGRCLNWKISVSALNVIPLTPDPSCQLPAILKWLWRFLNHTQKLLGTEPTTFKLFTTSLLKQTLNSQKHF